MRRVFVFSLVLGSFGAAAWACTFPDVEFDPSGGAEAGSDAMKGGSDSATLHDAATGSDVVTGSMDTGAPNADLDASADADAADDDAGDAGGDVLPEAGADGGCGSCDCDHDGYLTNLYAGCEHITSAVDCDDLDPQTHPDAGFQARPAKPPTNGDWDCSGKVDKSVVESLDCTQILVLAGCGQAGFTGVVDCGASGTYVQCKATLGLTCAAGAISTAQQLCK